jgi:hypothetical protein
MSIGGRRTDPSGDEIMFRNQKDDPPGGTTGRVECDTGVDEAPRAGRRIHDQGIGAKSSGSADLARAFSSEVDTGSREENASKQK